jgi:hypothetical protein
LGCLWITNYDRIGGQHPCQTISQFLTAGK